MVRIIIDDTESTKEEHERPCKVIMNKNENEYLQDFIDQEGVRFSSRTTIL